MFKRLVLLCALICLSVAQVDQQVRHIIYNDANLIEASRGYAINAPALLTQNWKTVSVNGDNVQIFTPTCQLASISSVEQQNLIASAKQSLSAIESGGQYGGSQTMNGQMVRLSSTRFSMNGNSISSMATNLGTSNFNSDGLSITKYDDNNMSIAKPNFPDNIARIFLDNDVVTFVYRDGRVLMKPAACLTSNEQQFIQQLRSEVVEAKQKFDLRMQQFSQNMQANMQNMHRNMQMNMANMFQPGFSFNRQRRSMGQYGATMAQNNGYMGAGYPHGDGASAYAGGLSGPAAYSQAGGIQSAAGAGANWPFGQANSPFYPGFPFGRR